MTKQSPREKWFTLLLQERLCKDLNFAENDKYSFIFSPKHNEKKIVFKKNCIFYNAGDLNAKMTFWDSSREDFTAAYDTIFPILSSQTFSPDSKLITYSKSGVLVKYDILGFCYWMLNRLEEINSKSELDAHGRFRSSASDAFKNNYLHRPIVDEWFFIISQLVKFIWPSSKLIENNYSVEVSHDVDRPSISKFSSHREVARVSASYFKKGNFGNGTLTIASKYLARKNEFSILDPYNTFDWIINTSNYFSCKSTFNFVVGSKNKKFDPRYDVEHPATIGLIKNIKNHGHTLGLHPSYDAYRDALLLEHQFDKLRTLCAKNNIYQEKWSSRMHYLRWEHIKSINALSNAGINIDTTLGYADQIGFRCGTCHEFPIFDHENNKLLALTMQPLIVMEGTLLHSSYMALGSKEDILQKVSDIITACKSVGGKFTLLWHNCHLDTVELKQLYSDIMFVANDKSF